MDTTLLTIVCKHFRVGIYFCWIRQPSKKDYLLRQQRSLLWLVELQVVMATQRHSRVHQSRLILTNKALPHHSDCNHNNPHRSINISTIPKHRDTWNTHLAIRHHLLGAKAPTTIKSSVIGSVQIEHARVKEKARKKPLDRHMHCR